MNIRSLFSCFKPISQGKSVSRYVSISNDFKDVSPEAFKYLKALETDIAEFAKNNNVKVKISPRANYNKYLGKNIPTELEKVSVHDVVLPIKGTNSRCRIKGTGVYSRPVQNSDSNVSMSIMDLEVKYLKKVKSNKLAYKKIDHQKSEVPFVLNPAFEETQAPFGGELLSFLKNIVNNLNKKNL